MCKGPTGQREQLCDVGITYLERTAFIFNHVCPCVSSKKDTSRKEMSTSSVTSLAGEQPCLTAETRACNARYLETRIGRFGLISAVAASLKGKFERMKQE
jgi:hypothetical protein